MDREQIKTQLKLYAWPVILTILGLILVFSPDTASALISKIIGWILIAIGVGSVITALTGFAFERPRTLVYAALCLGLGIFVTSFPLVLAEALGRFFGIFLTIQGVGSVRKALQKKQADLPWQYSMGIAVVTLVAGVILALLPLTLSRIILNICGVVLVIIGIVNIVGTWQEHKALESGEKPTIIDADE